MIIEIDFKYIDVFLFIEFLILVDKMYYVLFKVDLLFFRRIVRYLYYFNSEL